MSDHVHVFLPGDCPLTLLLLHGTGGNEHDLIDMGRKLLPGASLLSPRGKVLEGKMSRWFRRMGLGVFDVEDLKQRAAELAEFVTRMAPGRVIAVGYSNGANIAGGLLLGHPDVLAGAVLLRPAVPYVPETLPDLKGKSVWIGAGTNDSYSTPRDIRRLEQMLREAGADVTVHRVPGGHGLTQEDIEAAAEWLHSVV